MEVVENKDWQFFKASFDNEGNPDLESLFVSVPKVTKEKQGALDALIKQQTHINNLAKSIQKQMHDAQVEWMERVYPNEPLENMVISDYGFRDGVLHDYVFRHKTEPNALHVLVTISNSFDATLTGSIELNLTTKEILWK